MEFYGYSIMIYIVTIVITLYTACTIIIQLAIQMEKVNKHSFQSTEPSADTSPLG